ncbi:putative multicopper oxidase protein [Corchorus olitorius]|uniref:Multicopper oxidase protein n=1 Tax=Corchorus olitorius TaxID=93759 RepID=A0A1R3HSW2_9ROSI|nr:putative multicopper oxidase protein [Corchorus olitorius]
MTSCTKEGEEPRLGQLCRTRATCGERRKVKGTVRGGQNRPAIPPDLAVKTG